MINLSCFLSAMIAAVETNSRMEGIGVVMTDWEAIGLAPRKVVVIAFFDGDCELSVNPFRKPPRVIGSPIRRAAELWEPY